MFANTYVFWHGWYTTLRDQFIYSPQSCVLISSRQLRLFTNIILSNVDDEVVGVQAAGGACVTEPAVLGHARGRNDVSHS